MLYPKIGDLLRKTIDDAKLDNIKSREFKSNKERLVMIYFLLNQRKDLDQTKRQELIQSILVKYDMQSARNILAGPSKDDFKQTKSNTLWLPIIVLRDMLFNEDVSPPNLFQEARDIAAHMSDPDFLMDLKKSLSLDDETFKTTVANTEAMAQSYFEVTISNLLNKLLPRARHIQQEECIKQVQRELSSQAKKDIEGFRMEFIREIEEGSESESKSWVVPVL